MILKIEHLSKSYRKKQALCDFSATFVPGIYGILGPNGSGKTTLMNILTDNLKADSGTISLDGNDVRSMGRKFRKRLGYKPQMPGFYPSFTARQFMGYMAVLKDIPKRDQPAEIDNALDSVDLIDDADRPVGSYSGGMQQRLSIAQALLGRPDILILDEPTAGLDPNQRIQLGNHLSSISRDRIILIATHIISDVETIANEIIFLKQGRVAALGSPRELADRAAGHVWDVNVHVEEIDELRERYQVISIANSEGGAKARILSLEKPSGIAVPVCPSLEDYYMKVFSEEKGLAGE